MGNDETAPLHKHGTADGDANLQANIRNWLRTEGYPTELNAAAILRAVGFEVRQGMHYIDPDSSKSREIDLVCLARDPRGIAQLSFVAECKSSAKPWIVFTSPYVLKGYNRFGAYALLSDAPNLL
jgi:hypothetical protein